MFLKFFVVAFLVHLIKQSVRLNQTQDQMALNYQFCFDLVPASTIINENAPLIFSFAYTATNLFESSHSAFTVRFISPALNTECGPKQPIQER